VWGKKEAEMQDHRAWSSGAAQRRRARAIAISRTRTTEPTRLAVGLAVLLGLSLLVSAQAFGQTTSGNANGDNMHGMMMDTTKRPAGGVPRGVIVPKGSVDPNMSVKSPHMPAGSTPVIRPEQGELGKGGAGAQTGAPGGATVIPR